MNNNVKTLVAFGLLVGVMIGWYMYFNKSYDPIVFLDKEFKHVEESSRNEHVAIHFFTLGGVPWRESNEYLRIINLGPKVSLQQRNSVDRRLRQMISAEPVEGRSDRLFGTK